jgi:hypothetical protein
LVLALLAVCVLLPLAVYIFILAQLNRRPHPVMVSGAWDFAGVLFALSGFLLLGGPFIMASLNQDWREFWIRSPLRSLQGLSEQWWYLRLAVWGAYFLALAGGSIWLLRGRSRTTSIYNVTPDALDQSLESALDRLQLPWRRTRGRIVIGYPVFADEHVGQEEPKRAQVDRKEGEPAESETGYAISSRPAVLDPQSSAPLSQRYDPAESNPPRTTVEIDPFPAMHHVTLHWSKGGGPLRKEVEEELAKSLAEVETTYNPAVMWLMSVATVLLSTVTFGLLMLILFVVFVFYGN